MQVALEEKNMKWLVMVWLRRPPQYPLCSCKVVEKNIYNLFGQILGKLKMFIF